MYTALCALYHIVYTESACMTGGTEFHRAAVVDQVAAQHTDQLRHLLWRYVTVAYAEGTEHCSFRCWQYIKRRCARVADAKAQACGRAGVSPPSKMTKEWQDLTAAALYHALGSYCGMLLLRHSSICSDIINKAATWLSHSAVHRLLLWLMGAPAGLKLHTELSHVLSSAGLWWLQCAEAYFVMVAKPALPVMLGVAATAGMIGGMPMLLAVVQDLLTLAAAPITLAYMALCKLYRLQIYCTCTTWRLMRGNRDVLSSLRKRYRFQASPRKALLSHQEAAQDELKLEQMIVGVLLFTPLLLLLPTTTVYYVLALVLHTTVYFTCEAMHLAAELLYLNPACFLWCWVFQPSMVSDSVAILATKQQCALLLPGSPCPTLALKIIPMPRNLEAEIGSVFQKATQFLTINKLLLADMLAGKPIGCSLLQSAAEAVQHYTIKVACMSKKA